MSELIKRYYFGQNQNDALEYTQREQPSALPFGVVIKIAASSVNPHDWKYYDFLKPFARLPLIKFDIGHDVSGTVVAVGAGVTRFKVGDEVFTMSARTGAFGESVCVNQWMVSHKPSNISHIEAATVPMAGLTAWQVFILTRLEEGDRVLLNGASGGVGIHALQIAKAQGAHVIAVCSTRNIELVESLGADEVVDYTQQDIHQLNQKFDVVFDAVGIISPFKCDHLVREKGYFATTLPDWRTYSSLVLSRLPFRSLLGLGHLRKTITLLAMPMSWHLEKMKVLVEDGQLKPIVDKVFPIEQLDEAFDYSRTGRARGKIALDVSGESKS